MNSIEINIDFSQIRSYRALIHFFQEAHSLVENDTIYLLLDFSSNSFVHSDHLLTVVVIVNYFRAKGIIVTIDVRGECNYAARVNFFNLLGLSYSESFTRRGNVGRFIELSSFTEDSTYTLQDNLTMILHQLPIDIEVKHLMFYCLAEIMDNVLIHSRQENGWMCTQFYPSAKKIRLMICDNGVGILNALQSGDRQEYRDINEADALELCVQRGVTNGLGLGFGLYATSRFIQLNGGEMLLCSGHHTLDINGDQSTVSHGSYWPGTIVALLIHTDIPVDYQDIMPGHHTLPDDYQFFIDKFFGEDNELW